MEELTLTGVGGVNSLNAARSTEGGRVKLHWCTGGGGMKPDHKGGGGSVDPLEGAASAGGGGRPR